MILDEKLVLSDEQAVTDSAASTNVVDFGVANPNIGEGTPLYFNCVVGSEAFAAAAAATLKVHLQDSADNSAFDDLLVTADIGKASLVAGAYVIKVALPNVIRQYARAYFTVGTGPMTAGKVNAWIGAAAE